MLKRPGGRIRKARESIKHSEKEVLWSPEVMSNILSGRITKILKVLLVTTAIKKAIMPTNI